MIEVKRHKANPILIPDSKNCWQAEAVFNGCLAKDEDKFHFVYRAMSSSQLYYGKNIHLSSIGYAESSDGICFKKRRQFITPEYKWEQFGCEDPRVTKINDKYYIFYTALSGWPPSPVDIKVGVAITYDFKKIEEVHQATNFNSKGMALFPEKIKNKLVAVLTVNTDKPPVKIALAYFDSEEQIWSKEYWQHWLAGVEKYSLLLKRNPNDHIEVGAPPVKTSKGWLLVYCYIKNYKTPPPIFGIEAVLLDLENPLKIVGRTTEPLLVPRKEYELYGKVPNVIFPSGAYIKDDRLYIYYGGADTVCCLASLKLEELLDEMVPRSQFIVLGETAKRVKLQRFKGNPIITPKKENKWEAKYVFNPAAVYEAEKVYIVYRAMGEDETSVLGLAVSKDGLHISKRLDKPIYIPREDFEKKAKEGFSGCEDPRITKLGDKFYMCYTAYDGKNPTRVTLTSIKISDFIDKKWNWEKPRVISAPERSDKNACIMSEKIKGKYALFHRVGGCIWIDFVDNLKFGEKHWLGGKIILSPRVDKWDNRKIGIAAPPIKTEDGWLLLYHALSGDDNRYRLGALMLDLKNPDKILCRLDYPILEPEADYEIKGFRPGTVFSCGAVVLESRLLVYYGAADQVVSVASIGLDKILEELKKYRL